MQLPLDEERYGQVLQACALVPDLELLPAGDQTEIGIYGSDTCVIYGVVDMSTHGLRLLIVCKALPPPCA